ncbi:MAG: Gldg family protein [Verrucomicrobia bacterium]|nr:Gldg family protein [Verrucomicrobiota bacterium]
MSEPTAETNEKTARPLNRWGLGSLAVVQSVLLAVIVIALNYLAVHYYTRADLSRSADYTLSSSTRRYLASEALASRKTPVKWIMAFRRTSPFYERVRALAEEYARLSKGKIKLKIVDPLRNPERLQEVTAAYGLTLVRDMIIIDARSDESPVTRENSNKTRVLNPHVKLVVAEDMGMFATAEGKRKLIGFQGEDLLTARLVESIEGHPRKMALLADKSRIDADGGISPRKSLQDTLRFQNIELDEINLAGLADIPDDVAGIVLAAPKYDLTDAELAVLESYWNKPRAAMLVLIDAGVAPPKLRAFLRSYGITPHQDRVIAREKKSLVTSARGIFTKGVKFTRDLAGQTTEFGGASSSLDVREGSDDLLNRRIYPMGLVEVLPGFWGETKFGQGNEAFDEKEDHKPPLFLAACVTRGAESDDRFAADTSRLIVVSNTDFLDPKYQLAENLDFLASSVNWLVGREALAGIGPRSLGTYKLPLLDVQISFINRVNLFFLPACFVLIGAFVWSSRRV